MNSQVNNASRRADCVRGGLFRNENIKLWHQTGLRVVLIAVLAICLLIPVFINGLEGLLSGGDYVESLESQAEYWVSEAEFNISMSNDAYSAEEKTALLLDAEYYSTRAAAATYFIKNSIPEWKYYYYFDTYMVHAQRLRAAELMTAAGAGYTAVDVFNSLLGNELTTSDSFISASAVLYDDGVRYYRGDYYGGDDAYLTELDANEFLTYMRHELETVKTFINNVEYSSELTKLYNSARETLSLHESSRAQLESQLAATPGDSLVRYDYDAACLAVEAYGRLAQAYQWLLQNDAEYGSWQLSTVDNGMFSAAAQLADSAIYDEADFAQSDESMYYSSYDVYVTEKQYGESTARQALTLLEYSLEHGIPAAEALTHSVRSLTKSSAAMSAGLIMIFAVVAAGVTLSSEFSSGTVRLLLAHPRRRHCILSAKLLSVLFWTLLLTAVAVVGQLAVNIGFCGVSDLLVPDLYVIDGRVVELPWVLGLLETVFYSLLPTLLTAALALLLSCLTHRAALSVALPLVAHSVMSTAAQVALMLRGDLPLLDWTLLPYYDMSAFVHAPLADFFGGMTLSVAGLHFGVGIAMFAAGIAVVLVLSYVSFARRQIKN